MALFNFRLKPYMDGTPEWIKKVSAVFGYLDYEDQIKDKGISLADKEVFIPAHGENGDLFGAQFYGNMRRYVNYEEPTKPQKLMIYRQMADYPEIKYALNMICDDMLNYDEDDGNVGKLSIVNPNILSNINKRDNLMKEWTYIFNDLLNFKDTGRDAIFSFLVSGELMYEKVINPDRKQDGLKRIKRLRPENIYPMWKEDFDGIEAFVVKDVYQRTAASGMVKTIPRSQLAYVNWDHFSQNSDTGDIYVLSYLEPVKKVWRQLQLLEEALVIYRVTRAPERMVFNIATGNMPKGQAEQYIQKFMRTFRQKKIYNTSTGEIDGQTHIQSMLENYFLSSPSDGNKSSIETLPGGCLTLDTKIPLLDGRTLELKDIIEEYKTGKENWAYSCNPETGEVVPGPITNASITNRNAEVMKITLDNGKSVTCTLTHKWPTWNKGTIEANKLEVGDSFIPFNKKFDKIKGQGNDYEMIFDNHKKDWVFTHRMVAKYMKDKNFHNTKIFENAEEFRVIHHDNYDAKNNSPENLFWMDFKDHYLMHSQTIGRFAKKGSDRHLWLMENDPEYRKTWVENCKKGKKNMSKEKHCKMTQKQSNSAKQQIAGLSLEDREKRNENSRESFKLATKKTNDRLATDPEFRERVLTKRGNSISKAKSTPEKRAEQGERSRLLFLTEGHREKVFGPQTIKYNNEMLKIVMDAYKNGIDNVNDMLEFLNNDDHFTEVFNKENKSVKRYKTFLFKHLLGLLRTFNYTCWKDLKSKVPLYNHKIVKIEYLEERQVVANLTIDGDEKYHCFHTYALDIGVFSKNSNLGEIEDITYFLEKLYRALEIPVNRRIETWSGKPEFNSGSIGDVSWQEVKFSKMVQRVRTKVISIIFELYKSHLKLKGLWEQYNLKDSDFKIDFHKNNFFEEMKKAQVEETRLNNWGTASAYVGTVFSKEWLTKKLLKVTNEEWEENKRMIEKEKLEGDSEVEGGGGGGGL